MVLFQSKQYIKYFLFVSNSFLKYRNKWNAATTFKVALPYSNFEMFLLAEKSVPQQMQDLPQVWKEQRHQMKETYHSKAFKTTKTKPYSKKVQKTKK